MSEKDMWNAYIAYLKSWADEHSGYEFYGMTPACFDEWIDCEYENNI